MNKTDSERELQGRKSMKKSCLGAGRGMQRRVLEGVAGMCELLMTVLKKSW